MNKNYITPEINVIQLESLCDGGIQVASVYKESTKGEFISNFEVVNEDKTKTEDGYTNLWGESNSKNWGED